MACSPSLCLNANFIHFVTKTNKVNSQMEGEIDIFTIIHNSHEIMIKFFYNKIIFERKWKNRYCKMRIEILFFNLVTVDNCMTKNYYNGDALRVSGLLFCNSTGWAGNYTCNCPLNKFTFSCVFFLLWFCYKETQKSANPSNNKNAI